MCRDLLSASQKERHKVFIVPQVIFANFYNISYNIGIDKRNAPIS